MSGSDLPSVEEALAAAAEALGSEPRPGQLAMAEAVAEPDAGEARDRAAAALVGGDALDRKSVV